MTGFLQRAEVKWCGDCQQHLPVTDFWKLKASPDGLAHYCRTCFKKRNAAAYKRRVEQRGGTRRVVPRPREVLPEGRKRCPDCQQVLPLDAFVRNRTTSTGIGSYCRPCQNGRADESRKRLHGGSRHYHLKRRYGVGADDVRRMIAEQEGTCPICTRAIDEVKAHVDHDHATGAIRAVLCFNCNGGLGQFRDDPEALRRAARYVEGDVCRSTRPTPDASPPASSL